MRGTIGAGVAALLVLTAAGAAPCEPVSVMSEAPVTEAGATRLVVHSGRLGRDFDVVVQSPRFTALFPGQKIAAVYTLDGGYGLAGPLGAFLSGRDVMGPAIVVSIDYPPGQEVFRSTDLAHHRFSVGGETLGGGGDAFEAFLTQDLKPFIEARYPADPDGAVLFGHSMGAVFAANVFARRPKAFAGYVIASFVLPRDPGAVDRVAAAARTADGQRVFLAMGGDEDQTTTEARRMRQGFAGLARAFRAGGRRVALEARSYPHENHLSYYPNLVIDGFRFVLPPTVPVNLRVTPSSASGLARYAGPYVLPDGRAVTVKAGRETFMTVQVADGPVAYLLPNGPDRYYAYPADLDVRFDTDGVTFAGRGIAAVRARRGTKD